MYVRDYIIGLVVGIVEVRCLHNAKKQATIGFRYFGVIINMDFADSNAQLVISLVSLFFLPTLVLFVITRLGNNPY